MKVYRPHKEDRISAIQTIQLQAGKVELSQKYDITYMCGAILWYSGAPIIEAVEIWCISYCISPAP